MKRLVFLTGHFPDQKRRNSMLWVTDHLQAMGWHVTFVTVGYSWLSLLRGDRRIAALGKRPRTGTHRISPSLTHMFGYSPVHPVRTGRRLLDRVLAALGPLYTSYWRRRLRGPLSKADLVIVESGPPVALAAMAAQLAPDAVRLYRVSDDIRLLNAPEALLRAERAHHHFNRISTGSAVIAKRFAEHPNVTVDPMGVPHDAVRIDTKDPYNRGGGPIAVCAGSTQLDMGQIRKVAQEAPNWQIHVIGRLKGTPPDLPNVTWHGELPFDQTLAFVQHADIGLAPFQDVPGVEYQITSSNRILLYRFHGLPILVPPRLCASDSPSLIALGLPGWQERCETYGRKPEPIPDWSALARALSQNGVTDPPDVISIVPETTSKSRVKTVPPLTSSAKSAAEPAASAVTS